MKKLIKSIFLFALMFCVSLPVFSKNAIVTYSKGKVEIDRGNGWVTLNVGDEIERNVVLNKLIDMLFERNDLDFKRGTFRVRGDVLEIIPASERANGYRIEFFGDDIDRISEIDTLTGVVKSNKKTISIFPASHFVISEDKLDAAILRIKDELKELKSEKNDKKDFLRRVFLFCWR